MVLYIGGRLQVPVLQVEQLYPPDAAGWFPVESLTLLAVANAILRGVRGLAHLASCLLLPAGRLD
jgi:hypothetical protein